MERFRDFVHWAVPLCALTACLLIVGILRAGSARGTRNENAGRSETGMPLAFALVGFVAAMLGGVVYGEEFFFLAGVACMVFLGLRPLALAGGKSKP